MRNMRVGSGWRAAPARPRGETAPVCGWVGGWVGVRARDIGRATSAEDHARARACGRGSGEAALIRVTCGDPSH